MGGETGEPGQRNGLNESNTGPPGENNNPPVAADAQAVLAALAQPPPAHQGQTLSPAMTGAAPEHHPAEPRSSISARQRNTSNGGAAGPAGDKDTPGSPQMQPVPAAMNQPGLPALETKPEAEKHGIQPTIISRDSVTAPERPPPERFSSSPISLESQTHTRPETAAPQPSAPVPQPAPPSVAASSSEAPDGAGPLLSVAALASGRGTPDKTAPVAATNQSSEPPRPAAQIAPVMVSLAHTGNGTERLTLRLEPAELGQVHIRIERSQESPAKVEITVERPETMTLLLRDQHDLHRALDQAGVPADGRTLSFQLASHDQHSP